MINDNLILGICLIIIFLFIYCLQPVQEKMYIPEQSGYPPRISLVPPMTKYYVPNDDGEFPNLLNKNVDAAYDGLKQLFVGYEIDRVPYTQCGETTYRKDRIRIIYDPDTGKITDVPRIG